MSQPVAFFEVAALVFGIMIGLAFVYFFLNPLVRALSKPVTAWIKRNGSMSTAAAVVGLMLLNTVAAHAQTAEPVAIEIPTDVIFTETNNWIVTFAPIAAIGIGITVALAVLGYIGKIIKGAFQ